MLKTENAHRMHMIYLQKMPVSSSEQRSFGKRECGKLELRKQWKYRQWHDHWHQQLIQPLVQAATVNRRTPLEVKNLKGRRLIYLTRFFQTQREYGDDHETAPSRAEVQQQGRSREETAGTRKREDSLVRESRGDGEGR